MRYQLCPHEMHREPVKQCDKHYGQLSTHGGNEQKLNFDVVGETKVDLNNFRSRMGVRMKIIWVCHR